MVRTVESTGTLGASRFGAPIEEQTTDRRVPTPDEVREIVEGPRRPIRWMRWLAAVVVIAAGVGIATYLVLDDETDTAQTLLDDGSFQANETARMEALAPAVNDGSFQANETARMEALDPNL